MSFTSTRWGIKGAAEMAALLRKMPEHMRRRVVMGALRKSAKPILFAAIANAPVGTRTSTRKYWRVRGGSSSSDYGRLRDNLRIVSVSARKSAADGTVLVTTGDAFWGRFVELGRRGAPMRTKPFLGPAFNHNIDMALDILGMELARGIERGAKNLAGPYSKSGWRK